MKSLLNALQEGRLVELPDDDKEMCLEYLAHLIEAIPDIESGEDIFELVKKREALSNTGIGMGVACPHVVGATGSELLCAVGWSPEGIDYGAQDGKRVHLLIMYYIPKSHRNIYLKELSGLTKAIHKTSGIQSIISADDIKSVRNQLLDWVAIAIDEIMPDERAKMVRLEARNAAAASAGTVTLQKVSAPFTIVPFTLVIGDGREPLVLAQNPELVEGLERHPEIAHLIRDQTEIEVGDYRIFVRESSAFALNRRLYDCLAIKR